MKMRPVGAELFHADGRIDRQIRRRLLSFLQFCERV